MLRAHIHLPLKYSESADSKTSSCRGIEEALFKQNANIGTSDTFVLTYLTHKYSNEI